MADDPSALTRWVVAHPWGWGAVAGGLLALLFTVLFPGEWWPWPVTAVFVLVNALMWRADGPAHRIRAWMLRRFPKKR